MPADVASALQQVQFVGAEPPARQRADPAVLEGLRAAAQSSIAALPVKPEVDEPDHSHTELKVDLNFVALIELVGEARAWEILAKLKEETND